MKNQALTTKKSSGTSSNSGANKIRRSNSKKGAPKKGLGSISAVQAKMDGQTVRSIQKLTKASRRRLRAGSQTDIHVSGAITRIAEKKDGKSLLRPSAPELSAVSLPDLHCLERRISQIEGLLSNFSPIVKDGVVTWKDSSQKSESQ